MVPAVEARVADACVACCECARLTALLLDRAREGGFPGEYASQLTERIWTMLQRAAGPMATLSKKLARTNVGAVLTFGRIFRASYHATAAELAFAVLNNARIVAGYPPIFPRECHPDGVPHFFERCCRYPQVFNEVNGQGFVEIGRHWERVRGDLAETFTPFNSEVLIGLIRKEAAQVTAPPITESRIAPTPSTAVAAIVSQSEHTMSSPPTDNPYRALSAIAGRVMEEELARSAVIGRTGARPDDLDYSLRHAARDRELQQARRAALRGPLPNGCTLAEVEGRVDALIQAVLELVRWPQQVTWTPKANVYADLVHRELDTRCNELLRTRQAVDDLAARYGAPQTPGTCRLAIAEAAVQLDGQPIALDMSAEMAADARTFLQALINQAGQWVSGPYIEQGRANNRWDRVRKRLPPAVLDLTASDRRKGYRLKPEAWRR